MFDDLTWFNVQVRYRTPRDGYRCVKYRFKAASPAEAKQSAIIMTMRRYRGSSMHEAEITVA